MIGFAILAGYLAGFVLTWRIAYSRITDHDLNDAEFRRLQLEPDRFSNAMMGFLFAMIWPAAALFWLPAQWVISPTRRQRQAARAKELEAELADLKRKAREYGLPL